MLLQFIISPFLCFITVISPERHDTHAYTNLNHCPNHHLTFPCHIMHVIIFLFTGQRYLITLPNGMLCFQAHTLHKPSLTFSANAFFILSTRPCPGSGSHRHFALPATAISLASILNPSVSVSPSVCLSILDFHCLLPIPLHCNKRIYAWMYMCVSMYTRRQTFNGKISYKGFDSTWKEAS